MKRHSQSSPRSPPGRRCRRGHPRTSRRQADRQRPFRRTVLVRIYDCDGTPAQDAGEVHVNFTFNQRGSSPFPYYRESVRGYAVTTNLLTGGTYTNIFTANSQDHTIVDNGDGTITITVQANGGSRFYASSASSLKDPGGVVFAFDIDYNDIPGDPPTTSRSPTRSGSSAPPPGTATSATATLRRHGGVTSP